VIVRALLVPSILTTFVAALSCYPAAQGSPDVAPDSLRGIVSITGTTFEQQIVLRSGNAVTRLLAAASDSAALSHLGGVEVLVVGKRAPNAFQVESVTAVSVDGAQVVDGVLTNDGGRLSLENAKGRIPLGNPPNALRGMIGARVWVGGPLDRGPNTYGVIVPAR
jgi:hypothetical protein